MYPSNQQAKDVRGAILLLEKANAEIFHRFMRTGRTSPALMSCLCEETGTLEEYVVKLRGCLEAAPEQFVCEVAAAELAEYFGISHPQHALVGLDSQLANLIATQEMEKAASIRESYGINFGTRMLTNLVTWPVDRHLSETQFEAASDIFAFDALIQNPDRRFGNPNLGTVGDKLVIFDHELAFSFRQDIFPQPEPWRISGQSFWSEHVFFNELHHKALPLERFIEDLTQLPETFFDELGTELPSEWAVDLLLAIKTHVNVVSRHAHLFREELVRRLA